MKTIRKPGHFDEAERIKALRKYDILDTPPDGSFDNIAKLASRLLKVPIALVTLVDTDRIWFKSRVGLDNVEQIERSPGLCASAILSDEFYLVEDAVKDPRTLSNPLVAGEFGLQFYAAAPLKVREGYNLGTLCIIDKHPRTLTQEEKDILQELAGILVDQLELRLEARKANARQNQLLSMVAHELKNPLTTIPAYAEMIRTEGINKKEIDKMCNHITRASDRMETLIKEIMEMARTQTEEIQLKKNNFDFASVLGRVTSTNLVLANSKQQKLYLDIQNTVMMNADETRMTEVAENLINNAIKYSPLGSEIWIRLKEVNEKAIFEVVDQGPGFTEEDKEKLFMPFSRLSARPTACENSTGIGLSIVKMLV
ncbi:MAG: GAF domain-containing sensor histidine kinase, partial [Ferruginibacter sp.]|nr:GAF domain-containing sensor histidine kinase [Chitinophagaceae bacterium]